MTGHTDVGEPGDLPEGNREGVVHLVGQSPKARPQDHEHLGWFRNPVPQESHGLRKEELAGGLS